MKKPQIEIIKKRLAKTGKVSRNWCLSNFISRLSAHIYALKKEGMKFEIIRKNGDFIYKLK